MTPNKKLEHEMRLRGLGRMDIAERIGTDVVTVEEWLRGEIPKPYYCEDLCKLFGKSAEELGLTKDDNGASHVGNVIPASQPNPPSLSVHTRLGLQRGRGGRQIRVGWLVMSITACIVLLLFALGIFFILIIPMLQAKPAIC